MGFSFEHKKEVFGNRDIWFAKTLLDDRNKDSTIGESDLLQYDSSDTEESSSKQENHEVLPKKEEGRKGKRTKGGRRPKLYFAETDDEKNDEDEVRERRRNNRQKHRDEILKACQEVNKAPNVFRADKEDDEWLVKYFVIPIIKNSTKWNKCKR